MAPTRSLVKMRIVEFYTKAREKTAGKLFLDSEGKPIYDDWVAYASIGSNDEVRAPIRDLNRLQEDLTGGQNPAYALAKARWDYIRPPYEAWKKGEEAPETGTPLSAANFLRKEDVAIIKRNGIRSIEEFAALPDHIIDKIQIPRPRELIKQAKAWLEAQDVNKAAAELAARDEKIAALERRLQALETAPPATPVLRVDPVKDIEMRPVQGTALGRSETMQMLDSIRAKKAGK